MGSTRAKWRANQLAFYDGGTYETVLPLGNQYLYDDFFGTAINTDIWNGINTNEATCTATGSIVTAAITADVTAQDAGVVGLGLEWNTEHGLIFEARVAVAVAPTLDGEVMIGVQGEAYASASNQILNADEVASCYAAFGFYATLDAGLGCVIRTYDGATNSGIIDTATDVAVNIYHIYRIDFTDISSVKFYIDGVGVATGTTFDFSNGANQMVIPVVVAEKTGADAALGSILVDYVRMWQTERN